MPRPLLALAVLLGMLLAGCAAPAPAPRGEGACAPETVLPGEAGISQEDLVFATGDGVDLHGTLWTGSARHVVVMVHGLNEDRRSWNATAGALRGLGFSVVAFDLRGHGQSAERRGEPYRWEDFEEHDFLAMQQDVDAAIELVRGRTDPPCIALVGASVGANAALRTAAARRDLVDAVALLSPGLDYRGITTEDALAAWTGPLFLAAARADVYSAQSAQRLAGAAEGERLLVVEGDAHGTNLLRVAEVAQALQSWLVASA